MPARRRRPRWLDFAPEVPGDPNRPDPVGEVEVLASAHDAEWTAEVTVRDPVVELTLTPGAKVQVRVTARNTAEASAPSELVSATVPVAAAT